jgi:hypothetical protein
VPNFIQILEFNYSTRQKKCTKNMPQSISTTIRTTGRRDNLAKNKKKNKGPEYRNKNAQNSNPVKAASKKQEKTSRPSKPVQASASKTKPAEPKATEKGQKSFFSNIVDSVKKLVKQSS